MISLLQLNIIKLIIESRFGCDNLTLVLFMYRQYFTFRDRVKWRS